MAVGSATDANRSSDSRSMSAKEKAERDAANAEKEAQRRISAASERAKQAADEGQVELSQVRSKYHQEIEKEHERGDSTLQYEREKTYENVRNTQRDLASSARKVRHDGERGLMNLNEYYLNVEANLEHEKQKSIGQLKKDLTTSRDYEIKLNKEEIDLLRSNQERRLLFENDAHKGKLDNIIKNNTEDMARFQNQLEVAKSREEQFKEGKLGSMQKNMSSIVDNTFAKAAAKLKSIQLDTALKLNTYEQRQDDPFYKLIRLDTDFTENEQYYELKVKVPEHMQSSIQFSIKGDQILVSGNRKSETEVLSNDRKSKATTASYQTFSDSFPMAWPIDAKGMVRFSEGDLLTVRVPKKKAREYEPYQSDSAKAATGKETAKSKPKPIFPEGMVTLGKTRGERET